MSSCGKTFMSSDRKNLHELLLPALLLLFPELLAPPVLLLEGHAHPPGRLGEVDRTVEAPVRAGRPHRVKLAAALGRGSRQLNLTEKLVIVCCYLDLELFAQV